MYASSSSSCRDLGINVGSSLEGILVLNDFKLEDEWRINTHKKSKGELNVRRSRLDLKCLVVHFDKDLNPGCDT